MFNDVAKTFVIGGGVRRGRFNLRDHWVHPIYVDLEFGAECLEGLIKGGPASPILLSKDQRRAALSWIIRWRVPFTIELSEAGDDLLIGEGSVDAENLIWWFDVPPREDEQGSLHPVPVVLLVVVKNSRKYDRAGIL